MITVKCPECYNEIEPTDRYCKHCGAKQRIVFASPLEKRPSTEYIVLCHMGMTDIDSLEEAHAEALRKKRAGFEFHYFIDKEGNIQQGRPLPAKGAFAREMNGKAIGVCFAGDLTKETMTDAQVSDDVILLLWLLGSTYNASFCFFDELENHKNPISGFRREEIWKGLRKRDDIYEDEHHRGEWAVIHMNEWLDSRCCDFGIRPNPFDPFGDAFTDEEE